MKPVFVLLADYANVTPDNKLNVMGIFNIINAASFPARHPAMFLVLKFVPELGDLNQERKLTFKLEDADAHSIMTLSMPIVVKDAGIIVQLNDVVFPRSGSYEFVVYLDDEPVGSAPVSANVVTGSTD